MTETVLLYISIIYQQCVPLKNHFSFSFFPVMILCVVENQIRPNKILSFSPSK